MAVIIFVRHGKALTNVKGILNDEIEGFPLVDEGREKAGRTAKELKKLKVSKLFSSPILRARETAEIIGKELNLTPTFDDRLKDRAFGKMINKPTMGGEWKFYVDPKEMGVESLGSMESRIIAFMESVSASNEIIVAVSHDGPIKSALTYSMGIDPSFETGLRPVYATMSIISTKPAYKVLAISYPVLNEDLIEKVNSSLL